MAELDGMAGNPSALHGGGRRARALLEDAREELAALVGAQADEVVFTSGGSEADTIAVQQSAAARASTHPGVLVGGIEHPAVAAIAGVLPDRVRVLPVDGDGQTGLDDVAAQLAHGDVGLVSLMWVNNEIGTIQPVAQAAGLAREAGAWLHTDAVQGLGRVPIDFGASGADLLSLSAHKVGGPVGIGALLVRRGITLPAHGLGGKQGGGIRSGTLPTALAVGFAAATRAALAELAASDEAMRGWRDRLVSAAADPGGVVNGAGPVSPAILNLSFPGASADDVAFLLDQQQIWCSTGSACRAGVHGPSEVLLAMGRDDRAAREGVRISFGWTTTDADVDRLVAALRGAVAQARSVPR